jgi:predicted Zn finger-like uncharacterized protein
MVITVTCPSCSSSFPVDPAKVPAGGVNARCSSCGSIFRVEKPAVAAPAPMVAAPKPPPPPPPRPAAAPTAPTDESAGLDGVELVPPPPVHRPVPPPPAPKPEVTRRPLAPPPPPAPAATPSGGTGTFRFGKRDPTDKAKRLARVLVSDMIMYNAERHRNALEAGTLEQDFEAEIDKSWKEFVEQVGREIADGPGREFWREALNDILAKGKQLF